MSPLKALWKDIKAARRLGVGILWRHPMGWFGQPITRVTVQGVGPIWLRYQGSDASVLNQVFAGREYDLARFPQNSRIDEALERILVRGKRPTIIDAGANIGVSSIWFALRYPAATIIAVEPDSNNLAVARRNVTHFPNILLAPAAIGCRAGKVNAVATSETGYSTRTERADAGDVNVITIADAKALAGEDRQG